MMADPEAFITSHTRLITLAFIPEIRLHVAGESLALWLDVEDATAEGPMAPPFWAFAWVGGLALARYTLDHADSVRGARILDLGAGSGLGAIASMKAGSHTVLAADIDPMSGVATALNAAANDVRVAVTGADLLDGPADGFDVVLVGDLFYERAMAARVLLFLDRARACGARVLTGDPGRSFFPRERFIEVGRYTVPASRELEDHDEKATTVWELL